MEERRGVLRRELTYRTILLELRQGITRTSQRQSISANGAHCYAVWQYINGTSNQIYFSSS